MTANYLITKQNSQVLRRVLNFASRFFNDFVNHFREGTPLPCSGTDHLNSLRMVEACIRASSGDGTVTLLEQGG